MHGLRNSYFMAMNQQKKVITRMIILVQRLKEVVYLEHVDLN